jgi:hypothetical protein
MGNPLTTKASPGLLLRRLLTYLSLEWISAALDLFHRLYRLFSRKPPEGMYEFLLYDALLDLPDPNGRRATFRKHQRVKFLQDNAIAFEDFAWGDGEIFARYRVSPGIEADRYREGDRWNVLISLRETRQRGDIQNFHIERVVKNGFTAPQEWQQAEIRHRTRHLKLSVLFPKTRPCQRAWIRVRSRNRVSALGPEHFHQLPGGRQLLSWETRNVRPLEVFTLRWQW